MDESIYSAQERYQFVKLSGNFYEKPDLWPDLTIREVLAVEADGKMPVFWGSVKAEE